ncbi:Nucleotide-binding universal stress protein, UspA family [Granulicella pectinivorans]|jgi:nucleotide-binding universal stress UspA family protein|uniref:Nucleotide-binding universal stress protein, UspA family n=1 Tax=Granulicella pectinivorans TaxID=474950 RepID=A0A1I6MR72_9BACT|nr:universal stress protein [Granulicella pectinivorans]SFS18134.1 Nucleotide-binding universal stress protein, UspA family [Granulicella pectinivorans]
MPDTLAIHFAPTKILVPIDFSVSSQAALNTATGLAQHFHAEIYLLHAIPMIPITTGVEFPTTFYPAEEFLETAIMQANNRLSEMASVLTSLGIEANFGVEVGNDIVAPVLMVEQREGTDLMVISTHGMSGWRPMIFGSTAEKILKLAQCPVLLLRSAKPGVDETETES